MSWKIWIRSIFKTPAKTKTLKTRSYARPGLESLEERVMPYSVTGNAWPNPQLVTISFMPDGTQMASAVGGVVTSNLFSVMNAKFGSPSIWEAQILRAAQVWAQQANINFEIVSDDGSAAGSGAYQQGAPNFGDIRIGGYNFNNSTLGGTYYPPAANNYSIAGDVALNTGQTWNIGQSYDLFTVASHEIGHSFGLGESTVTNSTMYGSYNGIKSNLASDDIQGIQVIYGARPVDAYDTGSGDHTVATAANISSLIDPNALTALVNNLDIVATNDIAYYTFTAPTLTTSTMQVQVQSLGLSLLSPKLTVYASNGTTVLGTVSGVNQDGTTLDVSVTGVTPGEQFYVKVQGADNTAFSTGDYALALNFGTNATPVAASPIQQIANGNPLQGSGGVADNASAGTTFENTVPVITGITPATGLSATSLITSAQNISLLGTAPANETVSVYGVNLSNGNLTLLGTTTAGNGGNWTFNYTGTTLAPGTYTFTATATDPNGNVSSYANSITVTINTSTPQAPTITGITSGIAVNANLAVTNVPTLTLQGTAPAWTLVQIYENGSQQPIGSVMVGANGTWSFQTTISATGIDGFTATDTNLAGTVSSVSSVYDVGVFNVNNTVLALIAAKFAQAQQGAAS